jgi:hypothetical protein
VAVLAAVAFVAFVGEKLAERIIKPIILAVAAYFGDKVRQELRDLVEAVVCAIPGFALSLLAGLDLFPAVGLPLAGSSGLIITALGAGFGSNLVHDMVGAIPDGATIDWAVYEMGSALKRENKDAGD